MPARRQVAVCLHCVKITITLKLPNETKQNGIAEKRARMGRQMMAFQRHGKGRRTQFRLLPSSA